MNSALKKERERANLFQLLGAERKKEYYQYLFYVFVSLKENGRKSDDEPNFKLLLLLYSVNLHSLTHTHNNNNIHVADYTAAAVEFFSFLCHFPHFMYSTTPWHHLKLSSYADFYTKIEAERTQETT